MDSQYSARRTSTEVRSILRRRTAPFLDLQCRPLLWPHHPPSWRDKVEPPQRRCEMPAVPIIHSGKRGLQCRCCCAAEGWAEPPQTIASRTMVRPGQAWQRGVAVQRRRPKEGTGALDVRVVQYGQATARHTPCRKEAGGPKQKQSGR